MNKKGIMLQFLVTVILAIIIFFPACAITSKLFGVGGQAEESFDSFVKEVKDLAKNGAIDEQREFILILDLNTLILAYNADQDIRMCLNTPGGAEDCTVSKYPEQECSGKSCLCLCGEYSTEVEQTMTANPSDITTGDITCSQMNCKSLENVVFPGFDEESGMKGAENFYLDISMPDADPARTFFFRNGFIFGRSSEVPISFWKVKFSTSRRQFFHIINAGGNEETKIITISKEPRPQIWRFTQP